MESWTLFSKESPVDDFDRHRFLTVDFQGIVTISVWHSPNIEYMDYKLERMDNYTQNLIYTGIGFFSGSIHGYKAKKIFAWMPIPELPESVAQVALKYEQMLIKKEELKTKLKKLETEIKDFEKEREAIKND